MPTYLLEQPDAPDPLRGSVHFSSERTLRVGDLIPMPERARPLDWWRVAAIKAPPDREALGNLRVCKPKGGAEVNWRGVLVCEFADPAPRDIEPEVATWLP
jgi:hypothetical protein